MDLHIVSRTGSIFHGAVSSVVVPAVNGEIGFLPRHTPLLAVLVPGTVRFTTDSGEKRVFETARGLVTLDNDEIMVLVDAGSEAGGVHEA